MDVGRRIGRGLRVLDWEMSSVGIVLDDDG